MPLTPLHVVPAYFLFRLSKGRLSFPLMAAGSMIPDIEVPAIFILTNGTCAPGQCRLVLHSIIGAATLGTILTIIITFTMYPALSRRLLKIDVKLPPLSGGVIVSGLLGAISHPLVDMFHHSYNPLLFPPIASESVDHFILTGDIVTATIIMHTLFSILGLMILYWERTNVMFYLRRLRDGLRPAPPVRSPDST